jgi:hypothetical protein
VHQVVASTMPAPSAFSIDATVLSAADAAGQSNTVIRHHAGTISRSAVRRLAWTAPGTDTVERNRSRVATRQHDQHDADDRTTDGSSTVGSNAFQPIHAPALRAAKSP